MEQFSEMEDIDYIIHGANPTFSRYFIRYLMETLHTAVYGMDRLLECVYLCSEDAVSVSGEERNME